MSGQSFQVVACDGALLHAVARESGYTDYGEGTTFVVCLWQYQDGYHLAVLATYVSSSGAFNAATLGATLARQVVGDSSQFIPKTLNDLVSSVREAGAQVTLVEAYPPEHQP